jgi:YHYH protein
MTFPKSTRYYLFFRNALTAFLSLSLLFIFLPNPSTAQNPSFSTVGVACGLSSKNFNNSSRVNLLSEVNWLCSESTRTLTANGVPDHPVNDGAFVTPISVQNVSYNFPLAPTVIGQTKAMRMDVGYVLNGVKLDPSTAGSCQVNATGTRRGDGCVMVQGRDPWKIEAIGGAFVFGTDASNAHVQPNGAYHYHGMPEKYLEKLGKGKGITLVGFAKDGFPIYARYGYAKALDPNSTVKTVQSSYAKKSTPDLGRPSITNFPMGTFTQDYEYVAGSGDLDECNGRMGITPEFPNGVYHYYITDSFPYIQRCVKGAL